MHPAVTDAADAGQQHDQPAHGAHAAAASQAERSHKAPKTKSRRMDDADIARLVAEENEGKSKFPKYPELDRWELLKKMGDGAFSNVYRARDRHGDAGEVAIKVVRKFEMNSQQVSVCAFLGVAVPPTPLLGSPTPPKPS